MLYYGVSVDPVVYAMPFVGYNFPFYLRCRSVKQNTSYF
jgi:hypothetical protein